MTHSLEPTQRTAGLAQTLHDAACNCGDTTAGQNTYWCRIAAAAVAELQPQPATGVTFMGAPLDLRDVRVCGICWTLVPSAALDWHSKGQHP
jgi:hypothetical protein